MRMYICMYKVHDVLVCVLGVKGCHCASRGVFNCFVYCMVCVRCMVRCKCCVLHGALQVLCAAWCVAWCACRSCCAYMVCVAVWCGWSRLRASFFRGAPIYKDDQLFLIFLYELKRKLLRNRLWNLQALYKSHAQQAHRTTLLLKLF